MVIADCAKRSGCRSERSAEAMMVGVTDAPAYRIWPPIALGVPLLSGVVVTAVAAVSTYDIYHPIDMTFGQVLLRNKK